MNSELQKERIKSEIKSLQEDLILCLQFEYLDLAQDTQKEINKKIKKYFKNETHYRTKE